MKCPKCGSKEISINGDTAQCCHTDCLTEFDTHQQRLEHVLSKFETKTLVGDETPYYNNYPVWIDYKNGKFLLGILAETEISLDTVESLINDLEGEEQ